MEIITQRREKLDVEIIKQVYVSNQVIKMISKVRSHEELILESQFIKTNLIDLLKRNQKIFLCCFLKYEITEINLNLN